MDMHVLREPVDKILYQYKGKTRQQVADLTMYLSVSQNVPFHVIPAPHIS